MQNHHLSEVRLTDEMTEFVQALYYAGQSNAEVQTRYNDISNTHVTYNELLTEIGKMRKESLDDNKKLKILYRDKVDTLVTERDKWCEQLSDLENQVLEED